MTIHERVVAHLDHALGRASRVIEPFSHVYLENVFPTDTYREILDHLPDLPLFSPDNPKKYRGAVAKLAGGERSGVQPRSIASDTSARMADAHDLQSCRYVLPLNAANLERMPAADRPVWRGLADALCSPQLKNRVFELFADDLCRRLRITRGALARVRAYPRPSLIRDFAGYWIAPHPDTGAKLVTMQLYLPRDKSQQALGTTLYRRRLFNPRNLLSVKNMFEKVVQLPFLPNSGYAFPVGAHSWHGRDEVPQSCGERNSILLFYYRDGSREW